MLSLLEKFVPPGRPEPRVVVAQYGNLQNPCFEIGIAHVLLKTGNMFYVSKCLPG